MSVIIIILLVFAVLLVIFTLQNSVLISIKVLFWQITDAPLVLVLIICLVLGYILANIYLYPKIWKLKSELKQLARTNNELKKHSDENYPGKSKDNSSDIDDEGIELEDNDNSFFND